MPTLLTVDGRSHPVQACLLDKDGTLLKFDHWLWVMRMRAERLAEALSLARPQVDALLSFMGLDVDAGRVMAGGIIPLPRSEAEAAVAGYLSREGLVSPTHATELVVRIFEEVDGVFPFHRHLRPTRGAEGFLRLARAVGVRTAVITHDSRAAAVRHLRALSWADLVDVVLGIEDITYPKPAPDAVLAACRALAVDPSRSLMAGDTAADVGAGRAAGCGVVIGLLTGLGTPAELADADHVLADLSGITFQT